VHHRSIRDTHGYALNLTVNKHVTISTVLQRHIRSSHGNDNVDSIPRLIDDRRHKPLASQEHEVPEPDCWRNHGDSWSNNIHGIAMIKKNIVLMTVLILGLIGFFAIYFTSPFDDEIEYKDGMQIPNEACLEIGKISFLYKAGCIPCGKMMPIIKGIEEENNLSVTYFNILVPEENNELQELGLLEYLVEERAPVLIVDCRAYFSVKSESEYQRLILGVEG